MKTKNKVGELTVCDRKSHYKATVNKRVWYWCKDRDRNKIQNPETDIYGQLILSKSTRIVFSTTGAGTTGYPCAKTELPIILKYVKPKIAKIFK